MSLFRPLAASASRRAVSALSATTRSVSGSSVNAFSRLTPSAFSSSSLFGARSFSAASGDLDHLPPLPDPSAFGGYQSPPIAAVTKQAPPFTADAVINGELKSVSLSDYTGKYVVVLFYPLDFTFVCPTELISFSDRYDEFAKLNCEVLGVSVDSKFTHLAWQHTPRNKGGIGKLRYPLVADLTKSISADYNVLLSDKGIALRGTFVIDEKGVIRSSIINDLPVGRSVDEILRLVQAFQYADQTGEVVPCNWKPGKETMKGDPKGAQEYFKKIKD